MVETDNNAEEIINESVRDGWEPHYVVVYGDVSQELEILADYFGLPLDAFRKNGQQKTNNVAGNNNYVGNISYSNTLMKENEALHKEIETLKSMITAKDEVIQAKNEVINALRFRISQEDGTIKS